MINLPDDDLDRANDGGFMLSEKVGMAIVNMNGVVFNLPINKIRLYTHNIWQAMQNCYFGEFSETRNEHVKVLTAEDGTYYLVDGYHRIVEHVLRKHITVPVYIVSKKDGDHFVSKHCDYILLDTSKKWFGLEQLADEDYLLDIAAAYVGVFNTTL